MPGLSGFEVLELLEREVAVVFVTAYDEHAVRAFEVHAVDYLLKPFSRERLAEALTQARKRLGRPQPWLPVIAGAARSGGLPVSRVLVREGPQVHVIPVETLDVGRLGTTTCACGRAAGSTASSRPWASSRLSSTPRSS
jgi:two-component system LytT family response regulator